MDDNMPPLETWVWVVCGLGAVFMHSLIRYFRLVEGKENNTKQGYSAAAAMMEV